MHLVICLQSIKLFTYLLCTLSYVCNQVIYLFVVHLVICLQAIKLFTYLSTPCHVSAINQAVHLFVVYLVICLQSIKLFTYLLCTLSYVCNQSSCSLICCAPCHMFAINQAVYLFLVHFVMCLHAISQAVYLIVDVCSRPPSISDWHKRVASDCHSDRRNSVVCVCMSVCVCMHECPCVRLCACMYAAGMCVCVCVCARACTCACMCVFCNLCIQSLQYTSAAFKHKTVQNKTHFQIAVIVVTTNILLLDIVLLSSRTFLSCILQ